MTSELGTILPTSSGPTTQPVPVSTAAQPVSVQAPATANGAKRKQKKVRFALRKVQCDGQIPACGNCAKADALCIDVDSRDAERRLMRGSSEQAAARISWLESIIRTHLPHINIDDDPFALSQGEQFPGNLGNSNGSLGVGNLGNTNGSLGVPAGILSTNHHMGNAQENAGLQNASLITSNDPDPAKGNKAYIINSERTDLGLLSLNPDSRQMHYIGSSSGSLYTSLFLTKFSDPVTDTQTQGSPPDGSGVREKLQVESGLRKASSTTDNEKATKALYEQLRKDLPSRDECNVLLDRFFSHMHPNHPLLHRPSFRCTVDALYQGIAEPSDAPLQHNGWAASVQPFSYNGEDYISEGKRLIPISAHIAAFQLLMALSMAQHYRFEVGDTATTRKSSSSLPSTCPAVLIDPGGCDVWTLTHIAMAYAVDLGIHREASTLGLFSSTAIELRRRVFFCVYSLDRSISTIQGRPLGLGDETFDAQLPELSDAHVQLINSRIPSEEFDDIATLSYSIQTFKMAQLVSRIKSEFYRLPAHLDFTRDYTTAQDHIRNELGNWFAESTAIVLGTTDEDQRIRLTTKLQIQYHGAMCLLHQPSQAIALPGDEALKICYSSATQRLHLFEVLYDSGVLCHSWRTVQDMFLASATIMYCVYISAAVRASVSVFSLSKDFRACSSMLSVGGEWWPTIRKAKYSLERLSNYILETLAAKSESDVGERRVGRPPFPQDHTTDVASWPGPDISGPNAVQQTFLDVVNHDGRMIDFFGETLTSLLMGEVEANSGFDTAFWDGFE
ncbi:hypothetical protein VF21_06213 [Pseudogymnoascus sp. 05NY08]|nr:hypothetical protein VF21_06213 [Pseudogymnoascus sp. 05NY08]